MKRARARQDKVRRNRNDRSSVLFRLYVGGLSYADIGQQLGVSSQRVGQLVKAYGFPPLEQYRREGGLARAWMEKHRPDVLREIVKIVREQLQGQRQLNSTGGNRNGNKQE